jgi:serine O-acetyltransferase
MKRFGSRREYLVFILNFIRCFPHLIVFLTHKNRTIIKSDIRRCLELFDKSYLLSTSGHFFGLIYLFTFEKSFRNIFYYRVRPYDFFLNIICPHISTLIIGSDSIGSGFAISHGYSSAIGAKSIGKNCTIYQQVTIGAATDQGSPTILDNVTIYAGAIIIGHTTIGNNVVIGANATVFKDVPDNCTVLPGTSKIMHWKSTPC